MIRDKIIYKLITNIDSINKDSPTALLNALYQCEDYILLDENKDFIVNEQSFNYKSSFHLSFIANKDSLNDNYPQARKALYKSISKIKQERAKELEAQMQERAKALQDLDLKQRELKLKDLQKQQAKALNHPQTQARFQAQTEKDSPFVLESNDKSIKIIFLSQGIAPCSSLRDSQGKSWRALRSNSPIPANPIRLLGLTHPDELDKQDEKAKQEKLMIKYKNLFQSIQQDLGSKK